MKQYHLIVAGGGLSGVAAAVSAAREGMRVLLVEQYGYFGGMAGSALVNPFMTYFIKKDKSTNDLSRQINCGIFAEIIEKLKAYGGMRDGLKFNEEILKVVLDELVTAENIDVLFHSFVFGADCTDGVIKTIRVANKQGIQEYNADYFIDATGDADLAALSGCEYQVGREEDGRCIPVTLCFRIANVDFTKYDRAKVTKAYQAARREGKITNPREDVLTFRHMVDDVLHMNSTRILGVTPMDAEGFSRAEIEGRRQMMELFTFLKENCAGFENAQILMSGHQIGVRESRRIVGEYTLTADDLMNTVKFEDSVARGTYPIDIHNPAGSGTIIKEIPFGDYYTIPYRSLVPKNMKNLLVAGRPISATHEAHSAYRVLPICACIGHGAGAAAVVAVRNGVAFPDVTVAEIHKVLDAQNGLY